MGFRRFFRCFVLYYGNFKSSSVNLWIICGSPFCRFPCNSIPSIQPVHRKHTKIFQRHIRGNIMKINIVEAVRRMIANGQNQQSGKIKSNAGSQTDPAYFNRFLSKGKPMQPVSYEKERERKNKKHDSQKISECVLGDHIQKVKCLICYPKHTE